MKDEMVKIHCPKCGEGLRNHAILTSHEDNRTEGEGQYSVSGGELYQICKCLGCDSVRFREVTWFSEDYDPETGQPEERICIYPEVFKDGHIGVASKDFPASIRRIYSETVKAINCGAPILTGGGLRAIVEAICQDQGVTAGNLGEKIDELKTKSFLTKSQADLLHEERYIGNKALHEIEAPRLEDLKDGMDIIEGMLNTIYTLPLKAKRMKKSREEKK